MSYFPADMPRPEPTMDEAAFWDYCSKRSLRFQSCAQCATLRHPPIPMCYRCHSCETNYVEAPMEAQVYSYTVVHHASHPAVTTKLPYVVAVVEFPTLPGVRLITNLTDVEPGEVKIGMRCSLWWDDIGDGMFVPRFRPLAQVAA
jgi:uncharacterized OB-fold protein